MLRLDEVKVNIVALQSLQDRLFVFHYNLLKLAVAPVHILEMMIQHRPT